MLHVATLHEMIEQVKIHATVVVFAPGFKASFVDKMLNEIPDGDTKTYRELGPVNLLLAPELEQLCTILKDGLQVASKRLCKKAVAWRAGHRQDTHEEE